MSLQRGVAKVFVFPVRGRQWAFLSKLPEVAAAGCGSGAGAGAGADSTLPPPTVRTLWSNMRKQETSGERAELVIDFVANKMNAQWTRLEAAPEKSIRRKIHNWGSALLAKLKPTELFLKNIPKDAARIEITYPASLDARLVRRRVRHVAISGQKVHKRFFVGSTVLLPFTFMLGILPTPNVAFFWNLFRAHANWTALKGGQRLTFLTTLPPMPDHAVPTADADSTAGGAFSSGHVSMSEVSNPAKTAPSSPPSDAPILGTPATLKEGVSPETRHLSCTDAAPGGTSGAVAGGCKVQVADDSPGSGESTSSATSLAGNVDASESGPSISPQLAENDSMCQSGVKDMSPRRQVSPYLTFVASKEMDRLIDPAKIMADDKPLSDEALNHLCDAFALQAPLAKRWMDAK
eukprot:jgi/Mesen1/775/ME000110S_11042